MCQQFFNLAERGGFEPPVVLPTSAFQANSLSHSDTSLYGSECWVRTNDMLINSQLLYQLS